MMKISSPKQQNDSHLVNIRHELVASPILAEMLRASLQSDSSARLTVISNSMYPLLRVGDDIEVVACDPLLLEEGDVILFEGPGALYTHRVWNVVTERGKSYVITRGDRLRYYDDPSSAESVIGRVIAVHPQNGTPLYFFRAGRGKWLYDQIKQLARWEAVGTGPLPSVQTVRLLKQKPLSVTQRGRRWLAGKFYDALRQLITRIAKLEMSIFSAIAFYLLSTIMRSLC